VLVLLPEIALTAPSCAGSRRASAAAGAVAFLAQIERAPRRLAGDRRWPAQVVVGARSALFLPYARPGLIVVDEAHEARSSRTTACAITPATWR
jgi:primosomal protein N' (replication factor Y) (superfamily II helicase)